MRDNKTRLVISVIALVLLLLVFSLRSKPSANGVVGVEGDQSGNTFTKLFRPIVISRNALADEVKPKSDFKDQQSDVLEPVPGENDLKKKSEEIKIDQSTLDRIASSDDQVVQISLFDGEVVNVGIGQRTQSGPEGAFLVYGRVNGDPDSRVYFSVYKHAMFASLRLGDGRHYKIESLPQGKDKFELFEVNTVAAIRHQKRPGVPEPKIFHINNGQKERVLQCYATQLPLSPYPKRRMLGSDAWRPEVKVIASTSDQVDSSDRIELRRPHQNSDDSPKDKKPDAVGPTAKGNWVVSRTGQWQKKPVVGQGGSGGGSGGGMGIGIVYTPRAETLIGDAAKVQAQAGAWIAGMNAALKDSGTGTSVTQMGKAFKISKDFDGKDSSQMSACLQWMRTEKELLDWRDANKADLVSCIVEGAASGTGMVGLGVKLGNKNGNKGSFYNCCWHSTTDMTFSHEVGHNMGLGHDPTEGTKGIDDWSWGNHFTGSDGKGYCTIQAYQKTGFMAKANIFSGPNSKFKGTVTGKADQIDAVRTIKETSGPISKYYE